MGYSGVPIGADRDPRPLSVSKQTQWLGRNLAGSRSQRRSTLASDFSQYLHIPTITDPSLAPPGHHAAYTLIPVPNNLSDIDWDEVGEPFADTVLRFLDERGYIPGLGERIVYRSMVTPDYFEEVLGSHLGNGFGVEPRLTQTAFFRPHNRSEDVTNLYLVGQGTQPGGGTPSVMMSAKMTAREIARDFAIDPKIVGGGPTLSVAASPSRPVAFNDSGKMARPA